MSVWDGMARDAGYTGDEARQLASALEQAERARQEQADDELRAAAEDLAPPVDEGTTRVLGTVDLGASSWRVESHCGIVRVFSSRDGCMFAVNPDRARTIAAMFAVLVEQAAAATERASRGGER